MARYTGPKSKISRKYGEPIFGDTKALEKKPHPPGQHGRGRRRKKSEYAIQLAEKQKAKYLYGILEKQFRNMFDKASRKEGVTGENLLQLLEARLDNVKKLLRQGKIATIKHYRNNPEDYSVIIGTDLIDDYFNDIETLLTQDD